jgi:hypothetical protein
LDYSVFGYHDLTSFWKLYRGFAFIYTFKELKGNAIFLASYGLFGSLFGPKGAVFNSPFLIFSILGIFTYKREKERKFLLAIIILIILSYSLFHLEWQGGWTPRYIRYYTIPILFLTFFSFYYIQETKNTLAKLIFLGLVILSILNVTSLAVRADWTYEHESDLVSYDLVVWPWVSPTNPQKLEIDLDYLSTSEVYKWNLGGELVKATIFNGLTTDPYKCAYETWATRSIDFNNVKAIEIEACAGYAGGDGTKGLVYIDNKLIDEVFVVSNSCKTNTISVNISSGYHFVKLKSGIYKNCDMEAVSWKSLKLKY